jgi:putative ABC transport system permease protein
MKFRKSLKHAFEMVIHSKLRSWLTILGIVIGVAAVIAIVSISDSLSAQVNSQLSSLGGDIITINPGASRGGNVFETRGGGGGATATTKEVVLARSDVQALKGIPDILLIDTEISGSAKATYLDKTGSVRITGVDQKVWSQITTAKIAQGRMLDAADQNVIVIGGRLSSSYFSKPLGINQMVTIAGSSFRVVGVLDDNSNQVYMPIQMAYNVITDKTRDNYDSLIVKVRDQDQLNDTITKITDRLMMIRHVTSKTIDFSVTSNAQVQAARASTLNTMSVFLLAIAAVSLIVGAVGVANTMFTSVLEKTKEIGIMKAIGAKNRDIMMIFLLNSALIGLVGGVIGIILGTALSGLMPSLLSGGVPFARGGIGGIVSLRSIIMAISVSIGIGVIAGIIPAYQASRLKPVDALRYE